MHIFHTPVCIDTVYSLLILAIIIIIVIYHYYQMKQSTAELQKKLAGAMENKLSCPKQECPVLQCPTMPTIAPIMQPEPIIRQILPQIQPIQSIQQIQPMIEPISEYRIVGYLHKEGTNVPDSKYKILPVFGKPYRGDFFKYYIEYKSDGQIFRKLISKDHRHFNHDKSRELYDGDNVHVGFPIDFNYKFKEEKIDLYDEILY